MSDPGTMRGRECITNLDSVSEDLADLGSILGQPMGKRLAVDVLHRDEIDAVDSVDIVNGDDVWVVECGGGPGFMREAARAFCVGDGMHRQHLYRD